MAKRGVLEHPKTLALADDLGIMDCFALGILEAFWHYVAKYHPSGDLTGLSPRVLCRSIRYTDDADGLMAALIRAGWVDDADGQITVHDWAEHADDAVHARLYREVLPFADGSRPCPRSIGKEERTRLDALWSVRETSAESNRASAETEPAPSATCPPDVQDMSAICPPYVRDMSEICPPDVLPEPEPIPEPIPEPKKETPPPSPPLEGGGPRARVYAREGGDPPASIEVSAPASAEVDSSLGGESTPDREGPPSWEEGEAPAPPDPVEEVLAHLKAQTGRGFAASGGQARHVKARLRGGASVDDLRLVVDHRAAMWGKDPRMRPYLRPETIFGAGHWEAYLQDAREWADGGRKPIANGKPPRDFRDRVERMLGR